MNLSLVVMAAGMGSRFGGLKQLAPIGLNNETLLEFSIFDALKAGFNNIVFVIRPDILPQFQSLILPKITPRANVSFVFQETSSCLPPSITINPERTKPWGTAHAVLCAKPSLNGPFAVINADDYYGSSSFASLASFLQSNSSDHALVGFKLKNTLSSNGSVSRGICSTDKNNLLLSVQEHRFIAKDDTNRLVDWDPNGKPTILTGSEITSLNMWGFQHSFLNILRDSFNHFLLNNSNSLTAECFLPTVVDHAIQNDTMNVHVLPTTETWLGLTYKDDLDHLKLSIANRINSLQYPQNLWSTAP